MLVCEVISSHVWKELDVEPSKSPNFTIFSKFKSNWNKIVNVLNNSSDMYLNTVQHDENILLLFKSFSEESYPRNDYKELIELSIVFLGGSDVTKYKFKRPGALDKCRWMEFFFILNRGEDQLQNILQVVEFDRKRVPNQRKVAERRKQWYLQMQEK